MIADHGWFAARPSGTDWRHSVIRRTLIHLWGSSGMARSRVGRHFLQIPGPTNVPDRVLRAIDNPTIDHRGPDFGHLGAELLTNSSAELQSVAVSTS